MTSFNKTFLPSSDSKNRNWVILDCKGQRLGRLASLIAQLLTGKLKPQYHPSMDLGDYVILVNVDSIKINPDSQYYLVSNPGRPGRSLKQKKAVDCLPTFALERTIKGMLAPTNKKKLMKRLKMYSQQSHPHQAQNPIQINLSDFGLPFQEIK